MPRFPSSRHEISLNGQALAAPAIIFNLFEPGGEKLMRPIRIIAVILLSVIGAFAQTNKGAISGSVVDPNGAAVPGATVTITNIGTGQKTTVTTSEAGSFNVQSLDPVVYNVLVEAKGFKKAVLDK